MVEAVGVTAMFQLTDMFFLQETNLEWLPSVTVRPRWHIVAEQQ